MHNALVVALTILLAGVQFGMSSTVEPAPGPEDDGMSPFDLIIDPKCEDSPRGTDWPGNDITTIDGLEDAGTCCDKCFELGKTCRAFVYRADDDECFLKFAAGTPTPCESCFGRNMLEKKSPSKCNEVPGEDRFGGDLTDEPITSISQPGECCELCDAREECVGWLWRRDFHHCWLKGALNAVSPCDSCVRGDKFK